MSFTKNYSKIFFVPPSKKYSVATQGPVCQELNFDLLPLTIVLQQTQSLAGVIPSE